MTNITTITGQRIRTSAYALAPAGVVLPSHAVFGPMVTTADARADFGAKRATGPRTWSPPV